MAKILVIGAGGQLGQCLSTVANRIGVTDIHFPKEGAANILDIEQLNVLFEEVKPAYVVNCAAYTAVDKAEDEAELAAAVNATGAENLAQFCKKYGATLVHVSTDFVFEGNQVKLLKEDDEANPINVYGVTKLAGEQAIAAVLDQHVIIRTSWLYSEYANNFVKTMLKLGAQRDELSIIADQVGTPTYAIDLATTIFDIIATEKPTYGIYHYSNEGVTSWYDFAKAVFDFSGLQVKLNPISTAEYPTKAARPHFSVMDKRKIKEDYKVEVPHWLQSLKTCVEILQKNN